MSARAVSLCKAMAVVFLLGISCDVFAQAPAREEQLVYSILAFNGKDYAGTFARRDADTIYLIAGEENFLMVRKTLVYLWPITADWRIDTSALDVQLEGTLELTGPDGKPRKVAVSPYTYYNVQGEYEMNWVVATGEEAEKAVKRYQKIMNAYSLSVQDYYKQKAAYDVMKSRLTAIISNFLDQGKDVSRMVQLLGRTKAPQEPDYPTEYVVPPEPVQKSFILNLPEGEYQVRFRTPGGLVMEGSEKRVVVFTKGRAEGVGLDIVPGDKWTRPVESATASSVLYVNGSADLYLRPYFQKEYNDLYYNKMIQNDAKGNPSLSKWVRIQQVPNARIVVYTTTTKPIVLLQEPFYVEQIRGASLGYRIVPFDPGGAHKGLQPSLQAFHVPLGSGDRVIRLRVEDKNGSYLQGGSRQIRVIRSAPAGFVSLVLALAPLVVMAFVIVRRSRIYRG